MSHNRDAGTSGAGTSGSGSSLEPIWLGMGSPRPQPRLLQNSLFGHVADAFDEKSIFKIGQSPPQVEKRTQASTAATAAAATIHDDQTTTTDTTTTTTITTTTTTTTTDGTGADRAVDGQNPSHDNTNSDVTTRHSAPDVSVLFLCLEKYPRYFSSIFLLPFPVCIPFLLSI